ncbi:hypothetical protein FOZ60_009854 [Perkinsus olseni]|uniref:Uncharacterized protein n=1 Tax=Perkinsus olseni TaxID=32597 RepID=A0A7J6PM97_PEROL|nr:hypothetical protein FOZ60_009854 [Perkinsus olseni]
MTKQLAGAGCLNRLRTDVPYRGLPREHGAKLVRSSRLLRPSLKSKYPCSSTSELLCGIDDVNIALDWSRTFSIILDEGIRRGLFLPQHKYAAERAMVHHMLQYTNQPSITPRSRKSSDFFAAAASFEPSVVVFM